MSVPSEAELRRFFDDETVAREAHRAGMVTSWLSLRLLDHLSREGPASTGDLARSLNMDMREVRDRLDELADLGVVTEHDGTWEPATDEITVSIDCADGLRVSQTVGAAVASGGGAQEEAAPATGPEVGAEGDAGTKESDDEPGLLGGLVRRIGRLLP